jgi:hypothetical protein
VSALRDLVEKATQTVIWDGSLRDDWDKRDKKDAALSALRDAAPDLALLCADMGEALRQIHDNHYTSLGSEAVARLTALEERIGGTP